MQSASKAYKQAMKLPLRNRGYIKATIGIVNSEAQKNIVSDTDERNNYSYITDYTKVFNGYKADKLYATPENDYSHIDNTMFFAPKSRSNVTYNNGLVTEDLCGSIYLNFGDSIDLDIKGLTINFGECYPTEFTVENDEGIHTFQNDTQFFRTEEVFNNTSYLIITAQSMVNTYGRLRILEFTCGIVNTFSDKQVKDYSFKDFVSSICDSIPSQDMTLTVDNQDLYYSVDNPSSALAYLEQGQPIQVAFGYDLDGKGNIEWIKENVGYLKSWSSTDTEAKFTAVDRFDYEMQDKYYKGMYREEGITLYDLAMDVLEDAGITDPRTYYIDAYLKKITVYNPMPVVTHKEALQIIANAGRCTLSIDRDNKIHIQSSFVPDDYVSVNNKTVFSKIDKLTQDIDKEAYAVNSQNYTTVDDTMHFLPTTMSYLDDGYVSDSIYHISYSGRLPHRFGGAKSFQVYENGDWDGDIPEITIDFESAWTCFGIKLVFRSVAPKQFTFTTYKDGELVDKYTARNNTELVYTNYEEWHLFDKMVITFDMGSNNSRVFVDKILFGDVTDYTLTRKFDLTGSVKGTKYNKLKSLSVIKSLYLLSQEEEKKDIHSEEIVLPQGTSETTVYFTNASYDLNVEFNEDEIPENGEIKEDAFIVPEGMTVTLVDYSNYFATIRFDGVPSDDFTAKYVIKGFEYEVSEQPYTRVINGTGDVQEWKNPLIDNNDLASDVEEWLETFYGGDVDYAVNWRGDPRVDANDLFYLELKEQEPTLVRAYESTLKYNGAWSATMKVRKAVINGLDKT